jgi:hypothetical protein
MGKPVNRSNRTNRCVAVALVLGLSCCLPSLTLTAAAGPPASDAAAAGSLGEGQLLLPPGDVVPAPVEILPGAARPRPGDLLDASARAADGMLLEEFRLDEMPFEASSGDWFWNGGWYAGGESLWMDRSRNNRRTIAEQPFIDIRTGGLRFAKFTTTAQPFNVAPGARVTIGRSLGRDYLDRDRAFEFIYYGGMTYEDVDGWNAPFGGDNVIVPIAPFAPGFAGATQYATWFNSDFNSWEWDYKLRRRLGRDQLVMSPGGNWSRHAERGWLPALIIGPRLANVNEDFRLRTSAPTSTDPSSTGFGGTYTVNAANWLLGLNIGGELISQNEFFYWGLRGRAAPALSFVSTHQTAFGFNNRITPPGTTGFTADATRTAPGFIGDLTLMAGWNITPNFALQVGYDFLWVAGIATATRQFNLDQRDVRPLDAGGQTFYNGLSFGFNGSW